MRPLSRVLYSAAAMMTATAACGGPAGTPTSQSHPAGFPVTITRTGGIAGFHDVVVVTGDGLVTVTHKGQGSRHCRLTPGAMQRLATAASQVPWPRSAPASPQASIPDDMVSTVQSPAGGPVRLEGSRAGKGGHVFVELLNDLNDEQAAPRVCPPV